MGRPPEFFSHGSHGRILPQSEVKNTLTAPCQQSKAASLTAEPGLAAKLLVASPFLSSHSLAISSNTCPQIVISTHPKEASVPLRWWAVSTIKLRPFFSYSQPALLLSPNTGECTPRLLSLILGSHVPCFLWLFRMRVFPNSCMSQLPKTSQPVKVYVGERRTGF